MPQEVIRHRTKVILIALLVFLITGLHYTTPLYSSFHHQLFARFYYLPVLLAGFWFGLRGGLLASVTVTLLYLPHIWTGWGQGGPLFWDQLMEVVLFNVTGPTVGILADMERKQRARKEFIGDTFGRYVDQDVAKELMSRPEATRLGGQEREVAVLIADLRNFTATSQSLSPEGTIRVLNSYFTHMIEVIQRHRGIVVDLIGDGVLVFFDPLDGPVEPAVYRALQCAVQMQREMVRLNGDMNRRGLPQLEMDIGLNAGRVVVGNIGSESRAKYGIVGLAVNMTQRIQELARGGEVVISESILQHARLYLNIRASSEVRLKGVRKKVGLHVLERIDEGAYLEEGG